MLAGKRVVVLGGSSGIGFAVARAALEQDAMVHIGSSSTDKISAAAALLGEEAGGSVIDLADEASIEAFFTNHGPLDHLVYTAGDWTRRGLKIGPEFDAAQAQASFDIRFWGILRTLKFALPLIAADGSITLTSGLYAHRPAKGSAFSTALTGAVEHLTQGLAIELAPIRVNVVTPGFIATEAWARLPAEAVDAMVKNQPLPRAGDPAEAAEAYLYFMRAGFTTGQRAIVDGGALFA
jgi:NAD(P)-dependent dehydrogenase (short-subunit alcohol dehydrogenase family)